MKSSSLFNTLTVCSLFLFCTACGEEVDDSSSPVGEEGEALLTASQGLKSSLSKSKLRKALKDAGLSNKDAQAEAKRLSRFFSELEGEPYKALFKGKQKGKSRPVDAELEQAILAQGGVDAFILPESLDLSQVPQDPNNPISPAKVLLGALLFHETGIGVNNVRPEGAQTYSCATCHNADSGFQANRRQGIGEGGLGFFDREPSALFADSEFDVQPVRTPSSMNTAYQELMLWNGQFGGVGDNLNFVASWTPGTPKEVNFLGFEGIESQAIGGLGVHRLSIEGSPLKNSAVYRALFALAYPDLPEAVRITDINAGLAIAAYERVTLANLAPFQQWLRGNHKAMSEAQVRGAKVFFGKGNCTACHTGPALNSMTFYSLGMTDFFGPDILGSGRLNPERLGRGGFSGAPQDMYKFKTPQLYNLVDSPFYGHGGNFNTVREVVEYKNLAVSENAFVPASAIAAEFVPLSLSSSEVDDLVAFLEEGLYDAHLDRYEPYDLLPSGQCTPVNDPLSRSELGCD